MFFEGFLQLRNGALLLFFGNKSLGRGAMVLRGGSFSGEYMELLR